MPRVQTQKKEATQAQVAARAAGAERLAAARRRVAPAVIGKDLDASAMALPKEEVRVFGEDTNGKQTLDKSPIIVQEKPMDPEKAANLAFMEEMVTVHIHTTTNPLDEEIFELFNNGRREVFRRNETKTVKRYFVDGLARAKPTTYVQKSKRDGAGEMREYQEPHSGLKYPFSVVRDDNPKGKDWLRWAMAQGT